MNKTKNVSQEEEPCLVLEKCCGLDVHKKTCTAAIIDQGKAPLVLEDVENNGPGMNYLYQRLIEEGCSTVVMESTGPYWIGLYDYLELRGTFFSVKDLRVCGLCVDLKWLVVFAAGLMIVPAMCVFAAPSLSLKWVFNTSNVLPGKTFGAGHQGCFTVWDVDGDGVNEVVFGTRRGDSKRLWCIDSSGGFEWIYPPLDESELPGDPTSKVSLVDVDNDGVFELCFAGRGGRLHVVNGDGSVRWTWDNPSVGTAMHGAPQAFDVDGDGFVEFFMNDYAGFIHRVDHNGELVWTSFQCGAGNEGHPTIADVDGDGEYEVLWASRDHNLYCITATDGSLEWRFDTGANMQTNQVIVADLSRDWEGYEVVVWTDRPSSSVICVSWSGAVLWRWVLPVEGNIRLCQAIGDVDEDGRMDMVVMSNVGVYCIDVGGLSPSTKWKIDLTGWSDMGLLPEGAESNHWSSYQLIADIDGDGRLEVLLLAPFPIVVDGSSGELEAYYVDEHIALGRRQENGGWWGDVDGDGISEWICELNGKSHPQTQVYCFTMNGIYPAKAAWPEYYHSALPPRCQLDQGLSLISAYSNSLWFPLEAQETKRFSVRVDTDSSWYMTGETAVVTARVTNESIPVLASSVWLNVSRPDMVSEGPYEMYDDGTHGDATPNDGTYTTEYALTEIDLSGQYYLYAVAEKNGFSASDWKTFQAFSQRSAPNIELSDIHAYDTSGNLDNIIDGGEYGRIKVALQNTGNDTGRHTYATITTSNPLITITDSYAWFGDISKSTIQWADSNDFGIYVSSKNSQKSAVFSLTICFRNASNHQVTFTRSLTLPINTGLSVTVGTDREKYQIGDVVVLTTSAVDKADEALVLGASVTVKLTRPDSVVDGPFQMYDDGTHGDIVSEDGRYASTYALAASHATGLYRISVSVLKGDANGTGHSQFRVGGWEAGASLLLDRYAEDSSHDVRCGSLSLTSFEMCTQPCRRPTGVPDPSEAYGEEREADIVSARVVSIDETNPDYPSGGWGPYRPAAYNFTIRTEGRIRLDENHVYAWLIILTDDCSRITRILTLNNKVYISYQGEEPVLVPDLHPTVTMIEIDHPPYYEHWITVTLPSKDMWPGWPQYPDWVEGMYPIESFTAVGLGDSPDMLPSRTSGYVDLIVMPEVTGIALASLLFLITGLCSARHLRTPGADARRRGELCESY